MKHNTRTSRPFRGGNAPSNRGLVKPNDKRPLSRQQRKRAAQVREMEQTREKFGVGSYSSNLPRRNRRRIALKVARRAAQSHKVQP